MLRQYSIKLSKLWEALRVSSRINAPNADGWTALHLAAATPHAERGLRARGRGWGWDASIIHVCYNVLYNNIYI